MKIATKKALRIAVLLIFFLIFKPIKISASLSVLTDYSCTLTTSVCAKYFVLFLDASASSREVLSGPV